MRYLPLLFCIILAVAGFQGLPADALAAEAGNDWRPTYDMVMMWINFVIFAALIVKFARNPLKSFFRDQKEEVAREIRRVEESRDKIAGEVKAATARLEECDARFARLKQAALQEAEKRRQDIIEDAKKESRLLIEQTKQKIEHQIREAGHRIKGELIDAAIDRSLEHLSREITAEDQRKYVDLFLNKITG
jgi:F-type H+-transporting ATPase subunit b